MIVIFGSKLYGKVDEVPSLFYVATEFFHLDYLPLLPGKSHLIMAGTEKGDKFSGVRIGLSWKSVLWTYLRTVLLVGILLGTGFSFGALVTKEKLDTVLPLFGGLAVVCVGLFMASYRLSRASAVRALELAHVAGISPEVVAKHFVGQLGERELERLASASRNEEDVP